MKYIFSNPLIFGESVLDYAPTYSGIYMLLGSRDLSGKYPVLYVGQSNNIQRRLKEHFDDSQKNQAFYYVYHLESNPLTLDRKERELIAQYNPPLNKQLKPNLDSFLNFLEQGRIERLKKEQEKAKAFRTLLDTLGKNKKVL